MCGFHEHNVRYSLAQCEVSIYDHNDSSEKNDLVRNHLVLLHDTRHALKQTPVRVRPNEGPPQGHFYKKKNSDDL